MIKIAVVDATYLCHVALHSTGALTNGTVYGFLGLMDGLHSRLPDHRYVYCFDSTHNKRREMYAEYKGNRKPKPEAEQTEFNRQRNLLRKTILPALGCAVYCESGYEADDCIANITINGCGDAGGYTMVSADEDLLQLLSPKVRMWSPSRKKMITCRAWCEQSRIVPEQWPMVKAIAGCSSDNIKGIVDIGPKRAVEYLLGELKTKYVQSIVYGQDIIARNLKLVTLPLDGMPDVPDDLKPSEIPDPRTWNDISREYGMPSRARGIRNR